MIWWDTDHWHAYEVAYGDEPGTRSRLLASATWQTCVVDLTQDDAVLWKHLRKSYKSLIHKAERTYQILNMRDAALPLCHALHDEVAGRVTRSQETWDLMAQWLRQGYATLTVAASEGEVVAYVYCCVYHQWAYYASGASTVDNVSHALIWHTMRYLKGEGIARVLELGWQGEAADIKGKNIEKFKRGFGGTAQPVNFGLRNSP